MTNDIHKHMDVIGTDGVSIGKVDHTDKHFILLIAPTQGAHEGHVHEGHVHEGHVHEGHVHEGHVHEGHVHKISRGLVAGIEGKTVRLSANADVALTFEEEA